MKARASCRWRGGQSSRRTCDAWPTVPQHRRDRQGFGSDRWLSADHVAALVPVPVEGDVWIDGVDRVVPCDGEEYACRSNPGVAELPLDCGFDSHNREAVPLSSIDRMAVRKRGVGSDMSIDLLLSE